MYSLREWGNLTENIPVLPWEEGMEMGVLRPLKGLCQMNNPMSVNLVTKQLTYSAYHIK